MTSKKAKFGKITHNYNAKVIIRSPNWIGDCIMALPAMQALIEKLPNRRFFIAAKKHLCPIFKNIKNVEEIIALPPKNDLRSTIKIAGELKKYYFDYGLLFTNSFHSALQFKLSRIKFLVGYKKDLRGWLLRHKLEFPRNNKHHVSFYFDLATSFLNWIDGDRNPPMKGSSNQELGSLQLVSVADQERVSRVLEKMGVDLTRPIIGISPFVAYGKSKEWLPERFSELINRIQRERLFSPYDKTEILVLGSEQEREKVAQILNKVNVNRVYNFAGLLNIGDAMVAISLCKLFISNDSGLMHVASGLKIPTVGLFGPTEPHKTGPLNLDSRIVHHLVSCAPCKYRVCPLKENNHVCMTSITVGEVMDNLCQLISTPNGKTR